MGSKKAADKARRQRKRAESRLKQPGRPRSSVSKKYTKPAGIMVDFSIKGLSAAQGGFVSQQQRGGKKKEWNLKALLSDGFKVLEWDGRKPVTLLDQDAKIFVVLAGRPVDSEDWDEVTAQMSTVLQNTSVRTKRAQSGRRGKFSTFSAGVSYGGGQTAPKNLAPSEVDAATIEDLIKEKSVRRVAGFMSSCFASYAPKLWKEYAGHLDPLFQHESGLQRLFKNSIFPTATFNLGPRVVTLEHVDSGNVPFGLCAIFCCGSFNPDEGGHLILFNLKLAVRFPPGSVALIPSGTIRHGNASIKSYETRHSFTQYCPGGLFRWVEYDFQPEKSIAPGLKQGIREAHEMRCKRASGLFSKIDELELDRRQAFDLKGSD